VGCKLLLFAPCNGLRGEVFSGPQGVRSSDCATCFRVDFHNEVGALNGIPWSLVLLVGGSNLEVRGDWRGVG